MPEPNNNTPNPQAGDGLNDPQPQAGATPPTEPQAGESQESPTISLEEAKKLRSEAANLRKRLKGYEEAEEAAKRAQMNEQQRLQAELGDLQSRYANREREYQERITQSEIKSGAMQLGIINPTLAARALDWSAIEYDDNGSPTNIEALLKKLLQENPYLAQQGKTQASPGNGPNPRPSGGTPETQQNKFMQQMRRSGKYGG